MANYNLSERQYSLISNLSAKVLQIDETLKELLNVKDRALEALEIEKKGLEPQEIEDISKTQKDIEKKLSEVVATIVKEQKSIKSHKVNYDEEIKKIQDVERQIEKLRKHLIELVTKMDTKKQSIRESLKIIENLDQRIRDFARRILEEKGIILSELTYEERKSHQENLRRLESERAELLRQREDFMDGLSTDLDQMQMNRRDLLQQLLGEVEQDALLLDFMLQAELLMGKKWEDMTIEEKIRALLQLRGLRLTPSGRIMTLSGRILTLAEAAAMFEGIDLEELFKMYQLSELEKKRKLEEEVVCDIESEKSESTSSLKASTASSHSSRDSVISGMTSEDVHYLKENVGKALILAISEITAKQPRDPVHYLGQWLFKYRLNEETDLVKKQELAELIEERERLMKEKLTKMFEEEAREFVLEAIIRAEEKAMQNQIEAELRRIAMESEMMEEEEGTDERLYEEARDVLGVYNGPPTGQSYL